MTYRFSSDKFSHLGMASVLVLSLSGCMSLAPSYEQPELPVPNAWQTQVDSADAGSVSALNWRQYFTDPVLQDLIETALDNNRDLRLAVLRVSEARAAFQIRRADQLPTVGVSVHSMRAGVPENLQPLAGGSVLESHSASVGFSSWELDFWGRVQNLKQSALEQWLATEAGRQALELMLISQVADAYLGLSELNERVAIAERTVASRSESYRIFSRRHEVGSTSKLDLTQVQTLLTQAQSLQMQVELARDRQEHALAQLIGTHSAALSKKMQLSQVAALTDVQPGMPSELLLNRPDIMAAEHRLRAAHANIGAARAAFLPRIALTSSLGSASADLDGLFDSGTRAWLFRPTLDLPIFDTGRRKANLELSELRRDMAVAEYEKTIQTAFREVADALSGRRWLSQQVQIEQTALDVQRERARLAQLRYDSGSAAYLEVLEAQRALLDVEQQLVRTQRSLLSSQVALYTALGGGVDELEPTASDDTSSLSRNSSLSKP